MSYQAAGWARHQAPMLRTASGKPDTTAREILGELGEHADEHGRNAHPSVLHMRWATGYDERTIQRALQRLQAAGLIKRTGVTREGCVRWSLDMSKIRPESDWAELEAEAERTRETESAKRAKRRQGAATFDVSGTQNPGHIESDVAIPDLVRDADSRRPAFQIPASGTQTPGVRDAVPPEPSLNHQENHQGTITGGAPPPDPRRPEPPSESRSESDTTSTGNDGHQSRPSDHPLGAHEPDAPTAEVIDLEARKATLSAPKCVHRLQGGNRPDGKPNCPVCRNVPRLAEAFIPTPRGAPA